MPKTKKIPYAGKEPRAAPRDAEVACALPEPVAPVDDGLAVPPFLDRINGAEDAMTEVRKLNAKTVKPKRGKRPVQIVKAGSKLALIAELLVRKDGCTAAEVLAATGWPTVSMPAQAKAAGLKLKSKKDGKALRYWGVS